MIPLILGLYTLISCVQGHSHPIFSDCAITSVVDCLQSGDNGRFCITCRENSAHIPCISCKSLPETADQFKDEFHDQYKYVWWWVCVSFIVALLVCVVCLCSSCFIRVRKPSPPLPPDANGILENENASPYPPSLPVALLGCALLVLLFAVASVVTLATLNPVYSRLDTFVASRVSYINNTVDDFVGRARDAATLPPAVGGDPQAALLNSVEAFREAFGTDIDIAASSWNKFSKWWERTVRGVTWGTLATCVWLMMVVLLVCVATVAVAHRWKGPCGWGMGTALAGIVLVIPIISLVTLQWAADGACWYAGDFVTHHGLPPTDATRLNPLTNLCADVWHIRDDESVQGLLGGAAYKDAVCAALSPVAAICNGVTCGGTRLVCGPDATRNPLEFMEVVTVSQGATTVSLADCASAPPDGAEGICADGSPERVAAALAADVLRALRDVVAVTATATDPATDPPGVLTCDFAAHVMGEAVHICDDARDRLAASVWATSGLMVLVPLALLLIVCAQCMRPKTFSTRTLVGRRLVSIYDSYGTYDAFAHARTAADDPKATVGSGTSWRSVRTPGSL